MTLVNVSKKQDGVDVDLVYEEHLNAVFSVATVLSQGVVVCRGNGEIITYNQTFERMTGHNSEQIMTGSVEEWFEVSDEGSIGNIMARLDYGDVWSGDASLKKIAEGNYPVLLKLTGIYDREGSAIFFVGIVEGDFCSELPFSYQHDCRRDNGPISRLHNRVTFVKQCNRAMREAHKSGGSLAAVLMINVNSLADMTYAIGHTMTDLVLTHFAAQLRGYFETQTHLAYMGSDEFAVLLENITSNDQIVVKADELISMMNNLRVDVGTEFYLSFRVGISVYPRDADNALDLIDRAQAALAEAKRAGGSNCQYYCEDMRRGARELFRLDARLRKSLNTHSGLKLHYQPKLNLETGELAGLESLLRWHDPELGQVPPDRFIPIAEQSNLIESIGDWVLHEACRQMAEWHADGLKPGPVAVNVSARQLRNMDYYKKIQCYLKKFDLPPQYLELELTETALVEDPYYVAEFIDNIRAIGCSVAIDDFCTGYSSLQNLKHYKVDCIKIDKSFVAGLPTDFIDTILVNAVITLAHNCGAKVVAEGIETAEQRDFLEMIGCDYGQGFLHSHPLSAQELRAWMKVEGHSK